MLSLLAALDLAVAAAAWCLGYWVRVAAGEVGWTTFPRPPFQQYVPAMIVSLVLMLLVFGRLGLYQPRRTKSLWVEAWDVARGVAVAWVLTYVLANFLQRTPLSRLLMGPVLGLWLTLALSARLSARLALRSLRRRGWNTRYAAIAGSGRLAQKLFHVLKRSPWAAVEVRYFVDDSPPGRRLLGRDVCGPLLQVDRILADRPIDIVFVALPKERHDDLEAVMDRLATTPADVRVVPDLLSCHFLRHDVTQIDNLPIIAVTHSPQHGWNSLLKRLFDVLFAGLALLLLAVPMLLAALAIRLTSRGPILYVQERTSLGGRPFRILKFRTMVEGAEDGTGPVWAEPDDTRVTPLGRLLRRTSFDELPQLINVLLGDMSLVGPRPERPELIDRFRREVPRYMLRHQVKAGLTGWAQVHGLRGQTSLRKRVQYDLYYINNWSFGLDLRILLMTPFRGLVHRNAY